MLRHRNIDRICCIVLAATLALTCAFMGASAAGLVQSDSSIGYETRLFDQSMVHTIDIVMNDWDGFLETCTNEEYAACTVVIDGEAFGNVAIRAKGNTSLSQVSSYGNDRYSFKIEFDHYESGKTYYGLDKLSLNNIIQDKTYMKDYLAYTLMGKMGVAAPLCSFVQINVNGEAWGLYLAVEAVEDGFLTRNYGADHGELYKPDSMSMGGGRGNGRDFDMDAFSEMFSSEASEGEAGESTSDSARQKGMGRMNMGSRSSGMENGDQATLPQEKGAQTEGAETGNEADGAAQEGFDPSQMTGGFEPSQMFGENFDPSQRMNGEFDPSELFGEDADLSSMAENFDPTEMFSGKGGGFGGMGSSDVMLQYVDDDPDSYSNIFSSAKTDVSEADQERLIEALKKLSEGESLEEKLTAVDAEAVIRYLVVHNFMDNDDSYTGTMIHNYYLYEEDGALSMIPWDYNLAFGGFSMGGGFGGTSGATSSVNTPIDSPVSSGDISTRPILSWIFESEECTALYHEIYQEFADAFFTGGWLDEEIERVTNMIEPYVEADTNGFFTYDEFLTASETLREYCALRGESIIGQLNGSVPSTTDAQRTDSDALIDASHVDLSDMGEFGMGGGGMGGRGGFSKNDWSSEDTATPELPADMQNAAGTMPEIPAGEGDMTLPEGFDSTAMGNMPGDFGGQMPGGMEGMTMPGGGTVPQMPAQEGQTANAAIEPQASNDLLPPAEEETGEGDMDGEQQESSAERMRGGFSSNTGGDASRWIMLAVCAAVLLAGVLMAKLYRSGR